MTAADILTAAGYDILSATDREVTVLVHGADIPVTVPEDPADLVPRARLAVESTLRAVAQYRELREQPDVEVADLVALYCGEVDVTRRHGYQEAAVLGTEAVLDLYPGRRQALLDMVVRGATTAD